MATILHSLGRAVDALVSVYDPDRALYRHRARQLLQRAYEGASNKDGWKPRRAGASPNTDHTMDAAALRARSRALTQNVPYIAQGLRSLTASVIGTGIIHRWMRSEEATYNDLFQQWTRVCDADGRHDYYGLQAAAFRAAKQDGEVLLRLRPRRAEDGLPVPLQLQLLEIDWLDSSKTGTFEGRQVINGISYDQLGRVAGYWLFDQHPGETGVSMRSRLSSRFVPASRIIHYFNPERPGQGRGFPQISPVIARVRDLQLYEDAELQRKNLETRLSVLATGPVAEMANPPSPNEVVDTTAAKAGDLGPLQSGGITQLPGSTALTVVEPKAAPGYVEYLKFNLHLIAAGFGVTYAMMTGDTKGGSWTSERAGRLNFQTEAEVERWLHFIPRFCDPITRAFADAAELGGHVKRASYDVDYSTPKWNYVNPKDDVAADVTEIFSGLSSFSEKLRQRGYKPDQVFEELRTDIEKLRSNGVLDVMLKLLKGKQLEGASSDAEGAAE
ncbi:MAG TPA: phage portal protein [Solimonas sp.]